MRLVLFIVLALAAMFPVAALSQTSPACGLARVSPDGVQVNGEEATTGQRISRDDIVQTGSTGRATIRCGAALTVVIGPSSRIRAGSLMAPNARGPALSILDGIVGFVLEQFGGARFRVQMPSAVAAVRSTEWTIETNGATSAVFVREGSVSVIGRQNSAILDAGQGVNISAPGRLANVRIWGAGRINGQSERLGADW